MPKEEDQLLELADARQTCALWGPLEMGAKRIRQHRRFCLSSLCWNLWLKVNKNFRIWTRSRYVFSNFEIPMFYRYEYYMSISHMALIVAIVHDLHAFKIKFSDISFHSFAKYVLCEPIFVWEVVFALFAETSHLMYSKALWSVLDGGHKETPVTSDFYCGSFVLTLNRS